MLGLRRIHQRAALLGARGGVDIPSGDKRAVYNHLAAHYKEFDKVPPKVTFSEDGEIIEVLWMEEEDKKEFEQKEEMQDEAKEAKEMQNEAKEKVEKETPCSEEIEALIKAKDEEIAELKAKVEELTVNYRKLEELYAKAEEQIKAYEEKERKALIDEIRKYNPDFTGEGKSIAELKELLEFIRGIKVLSGRKSLVISPEEEKKPEEKYEEILRKKVKELMRRD